MVKLLSNQDIKRVLNPKGVVETVEKTWAEYGQGRVLNPAKIILDMGEESDGWPHYNSHMDAMPAYVGWLDVAGLKWVGGFGNNQSKGKPYLSGMVLLIDPTNGSFKCVMDGTEITSQRTPAQSVVGIKYLAKKHAGTIGIFGAGTQALYHIRLIKAIFPSMRIKVYDPLEGVAEKLRSEMSHEKVDIRVSTCMEECADADVIITLTTAKSPFLKSEWVKPGSLILLLGSNQEAFPETIMKADKIFVDHIQQTLHIGALKVLAMQGKITEHDIDATIGEIIAGLKPGRTSDNEIILFTPIGTGMLDIAVAEQAYRALVKEEIGGEFEFYK